MLHIFTYSSSLSAVWVLLVFVYIEISNFDCRLSHLNTLFEILLETCGIIRV